MNDTFSECFPCIEGCLFLLRSFIFTLETLDHWLTEAAGRRSHISLTVLLPLPAKAGFAKDASAVLRLMSNFILCQSLPTFQSQERHLPYLHSIALLWLFGYTNHQAELELFFTNSPLSC